MLDTKTAALCNNIKGDKNRTASDHHIYIYTITYQVADGAARTMLQNCATAPSDCLGNQCYFDSPTIAALQGVFANIALGVNQLRLAR